ncbi:ABC transporter ATP-binding protein [Amycolatopsis magusensis]|uniref:Branched-chain amino acid transport system ATP-binding protein n=1 Tax=Amycolatopsis magusensis TaxID=882444 RepID=A0ABS4PUD1_9PSEU|nr:ABC transporter ATP-binding protein [Amycolatopsis magusensis]MBP2183037.1 branched-chain amino acid transport system ATP-binding protein [Amycolatopsis magusensis]MDI5977026.1 ABC transporter ATP-binding protein [Amycolatopsis magusensis]
MLEVEDLVTSYGAVRALDAVSLSTKDGAITAVLGANGAGKTTLLRTIGGLVAPDSGRVRFDGTDVTGWPADRLTRNGLVHVPETGGVITEMTVEENLRLGALWRRDRADRAAALREVLELFPPLAERRNKLAATLSGGERQMLAIGRALMSRPRLLLLDEPSLGLAPLITLRILQVIEDLRAATGLTVLLVEQNARSALSVADHGFVLSLGKVVATDRAEDLLADDQLRHAYLGF